MKRSQDEVRRRRRGDTSSRRIGETTRSRGEMTRTRRRRRGAMQRGGNNEEEDNTQKGGNDSTPRQGVTPSSRAGWLCSCLLFLFLNYIVCMYAQTQGRTSLPWGKYIYCTTINVR
jgi:hypothetical protein